MPTPDKDMLIQGMLSEIPLRHSGKPTPDSAEWWREVAEGLGASYDLMRQRAEKAEAALQQAREALKQYGQHLGEGQTLGSGCPRAGWDFAQPCTCGLDAALHPDTGQGKEEK